MIPLLLTLTLELGVLQIQNTKPRPELFFPMVFSLPSESSVGLPADVVELKAKGRTDKVVTLKSGNFGILKEGCYFFISKDSPVLAEQRKRFLLAKRVLLLSADGRAKVPSFIASGKEFEAEELKTLSKLLERYTGFSFSADILRNQKILKFSTFQQVSFGNAKNGINFSPISHPTVVEDELLRRVYPISGLLSETDGELSAKYWEKAQENAPISTECLDGRVHLSIRGFVGPEIDKFNFQRKILDITESVYNYQKAVYRQEIIALSTTLRNTIPSMFVNFTNPGLDDSERKNMSQQIAQELNFKGVSPSDIESQQNTIVFTGKDLKIMYVTRVQRYGRKPVGAALAVAIWP